jgi:hypothetical protein
VFPGPSTIGRISLITPEDEQTKLLREILKWIKFAGMKELKTMLMSTLDSDKKKVAYQASDGERSTRDVASIAGFGSKTTVADLWKVWKTLGLGETSVTMGGGDRFRRAFDLEEFGVEVPAVRQPLPQPATSAETAAPSEGEQH